MKNKIAALLLALSTMGFAKEVNVKILGTSDVHGRVVPWSYASDTEDKSGSYAQLSTLINQRRKENKNVILVEVGDSIQDNSIDLFALTLEEAKNHPIPKVLNYMKYDVFVPGNHEFNFGMPVLNEILNDIKAKKLAANLYHKDGKRYLQPTTIIQKDGVKIGIIGLTTPMSAKFEEDTGNLKDYKYVSIIEETKKQVKNLKAKKVDAIVAVAHMGIENENNIPETGLRDLANAVPEIDAIVAGHMHQDVKSETINGVLITEPHRYGTVLSEIDLKFDVNDKTKKVKLLGKTATTTPVKNLEADKKVEEIYKPYHERLREIANEKIGETENDMVPQGKIHGVSISFAKDTGMSSFITDVEKYYSKADVVSFAYDYENVKLDKGDIKRKDIAYNYRYVGGDVSVYEMTGKQLKDYMEWAADYFDTIQKGDTNYRYNDVRGKSKYVTFDIFGGVSYKIDLRNQKGNKIVDLKLADGRKITPDMKLKVGMNSYRFDQLIKKGGIFEGQNIPLVWSSKDEMGQDKGRIQSMMIDYIKNVKGGKIDGKSHDRWEIIGL
ncbi:bifunctional UDP-sugar hydrolase/5'-nucleotidase [Leptotrichia sp. oral taxon 221]|uniref:bifunctional metallophosphatase/5'-nucleotidase n=1 Tax=Leptotrichia sp. oral taxon 221 TaxID=712362 RepID=UPI001B8C72FD|nr:5'-nucleotidase C-terminal domain-containing protein [Leptotrichia sp. oral taxon 221]QUB97052.1 5'-nucleotidase C-terminal domain-containing protein [Leptotrichia sp. oral taxon 221]